MKQIDIKRELKKESDRFAPDPIVKIKTAARAENLLPYDAQQNSEVYTQGNSAVIAKNKRKTIWLFTVFASVIGCLILILSLTLPSERNKPFTPTRLHFSAEDVYGIGAVSGVKLLKNNMPASAVKSFSAVNAIAYTTTEKSADEAKRQAEKFNEYFTALDSFFGDDVVSTSTIANTDSNYDYETKMTITGKDFNGKTVTYTMYYTETLLQDDFDEDEQEYKLVGIMTIDGANYYLEGERSEESEKDESETELKIRAYADKEDKTSYIQMEQEYSVENGETETEYVYSIYVGGELLEQTAVEFETENKDGKVETEYELEFRKGASKGKYIVKREVVENKAEIKVKYAIDGKSGEFRIREITDANGDKQYEYTFSDNEKIVF